MIRSDWPVDTSQSRTVRSSKARRDDPAPITREGQRTIISSRMTVQPPQLLARIRIEQCILPGPANGGRQHAAVRR